jgi:hypothetical protein
MCIGTILAYNGVLASLYDLHSHRATIYDYHGSLFVFVWCNVRQHNNGYIVHRGSLILVNK